MIRVRRATVEIRATPVLSIQVRRVLLTNLNPMKRNNAQNRDSYLHLEIRSNV